MSDDAVELWLPSPGNALPECLLGRPLLVPPLGDAFFQLLVSSVWTPLTWGDAVRALPHPDGGYAITGLGGSGPHTRVVASYEPELPAMRARSIAHSWYDCGASAIEALPGLFVVAWSATESEQSIRAVIEGQDMSVVEIWKSEERVPSVIRDYLQSL